MCAPQAKRECRPEGEVGSFQVLLRAPLDEAVSALTSSQQFCPGSIFWAELGWRLTWGLQGGWSRGVVATGDRNLALFKVMKKVKNFMMK